MGFIGIKEKKMEATSLGFRVYVGLIGIMEKKMETTSLGFRVSNLCGFNKDNGKEIGNY